MSLVKAHQTRFSLMGKVAVVTGGHRGLGRDISIEIARAGADVVVIDKNGAGGSDVPAMIEALGRRYHAVQADLQHPTAVAQAAEETLSIVGHVDILINNAGVSLLNALEDLSVEDWNQCMSVNLRAPFLLSQAFARGPSGMLARGTGVIVNVSSNAGKGALDLHGAYCTSKAGLNMLTQMMTCEWGKRGIRANAVAPTVVMTEMGHRVWGPPEKGEPMLAKIPQGRFVEPHEVADAVVFLSSDASSMVNGAVLPVDGGYTCV